MAPACLETDHTPLLAEQYDLWSLPQFERKENNVQHENNKINSHFANTLCYDKLMLCMFCMVFIIMNSITNLHKIIPFLNTLHVHEIKKICR